MNALKKYHKHNDNNDLKRLKYGTTYKNYMPKNKYIFNELYKNKAIPREELVFIVKRIINHKNKRGISHSDSMLKEIAEGFVEDHDELFKGDWRKEEDTDEEYEEDEKPKLNEEKNMEPIKKEEMSEEKQDIPVKTIEKLEEIKEDVKQIEQLKEHPDKRHIEEFNNRISELRGDIEKKFNDMIDSHLDLKKSIEEKRNISDKDAKSRIDNMEGKIEMLYGKQMEEENKPKKKEKYVPEVKSKEDLMKEYIARRFVVK